MTVAQAPNGIESCSTSTEIWAVRINLPPRLACKWVVLNIRRGWLHALQHPLFTLRLLWKRLAFTVTRRFVGETLTSPTTGEKIFNVQTLINYWNINVVRELYGPWMDLVRNTPSPVVVDVGSNIGQFTALIKSLNPAAIVYTVDPWPEMAPYAALYGTYHTCKALAADDRGRTLVRSREGLTASTKPGAWDGTTSTVETMTLDAFCASMDRITLIKIDVDGAEFDVLEAGLAACAKAKAVLIETTQPERLANLMPERKWTSANDYDWCGIRD